MSETLEKISYKFLKKKNWNTEAKNKNLKLLCFITYENKCSSEV